MVAFLDRVKWLLIEPYLTLSRVMTVRLLEYKVSRSAGYPPYQPEPDSMLYVAASVLPYHASGYAFRTQEVIRALEAAGGRVHAITRPGYPMDRLDRLCNCPGSDTRVENVTYHHIDSPANNRPVLIYALQAVSAIIEHAVKHKVAVIHAASNHVNALPALLAARQLGIPFQYEMRGLWELTRISRSPQYEKKQGFKQGLQLEGMVARYADKVFVISEQLGRYSQEHWGVCEGKIFLLPNCVDPLRFPVADPQRGYSGAIGYAGSLLAYEGLDTLIDAVSLLMQQGHYIRVHIVGEGESRPALESQVQRLGLSSAIQFYGRVSRDRVQEILGACELICIPRKPFKVCQVVTPIKLVESLATGKPVIVPDLPVFRDEIGSQPVGWFFKAGDSVDLARVIAAAFADPEALLDLGARARDYALSQRSWHNFMAAVLPITQSKQE